ncbi:proline dehydrogenase [Paenibacillus sp. H1-7]|uniref:proline dehydrogenase family protein n=1 Tax=Paenibacillus sp. H1-7 TaxID=2282849 RepID=UPI001EF9A74C|nr:proline dehydrogenase family protein [Paenibacillus sp. H1-7]ULL17239.1 proline dehydrogenase [Paenibacillus sp. H1-7]
MRMNALFRRAVLRLSERKLIESLFRKHGMRIGVSRFVAAETLVDVLGKIKEMNGQGLAVTLDYLGESVLDPALAEEAALQIIAMLRTIHDNGLQANVSVKLTQLGCRIDPAVSMKHMERIVGAAKYYRNFVRIDMEDSTLTDETLRMTHALVSRFGKQHVGTVIQAYLYRSPSDLADMGKLDANVRIVKGAYKEGATIAYPHKKEVDRQYVALVKSHMTDGHYTAIATHDPRIIEELKAFADRRSFSKDSFEFQMLYGISSKLQLELVKQGYRVRVYTPFGRQWYPYFTRRIAERPANLLFVLKGMLRR